MNLPLNIDVVQILLHILNLVILVGGLALILYRPVASFLKSRREHYEELERENKEKAQECDALKAEYEGKLRAMDDMIAERRAEAEKEMTEAAGRYVSEAKAKADAIIRSAEENAEMRKEHILESAQTEIGELVLSAVQKMLGDNASPESDSALYDGFIRTASDPDQKKDDDDE